MAAWPDNPPDAAEAAARLELAAGEGELATGALWPFGAGTDRAG